MDAFDSTPEPQRVLPVLEYRTADSPAEPPHRLLGSVCSIWAVVMVLQSLIAIPWVLDHYQQMVRQSDRDWSMNELERRMYEIDRLAGLPVGKKPPVYYPIKPHRWTPIGMAIALVPMIGLGFIVGYLGHSALARNGRFARVAKRWTRFLFILPALFVLVAAGAYGLQSWRLMTLQLVLIGWQPIGTLLLAAWLKRELSRDA